MQPSNLFAQSKNFIAPESVFPGQITILLMTKDYATVYDYITGRNQVFKTVMSTWA